MCTPKVDAFTMFCISRQILTLDIKNTARVVQATARFKGFSSMRPFTVASFASNGGRSSRLTLDTKSATQVAQATARFQTLSTRNHQFLVLVPLPPTEGELPGLWLTIDLINTALVAQTAALFKGFSCVHLYMVASLFSAEGSSSRPRLSVDVKNTAQVVQAAT